LLRVSSSLCGAAGCWGFLSRATAAAAAAAAATEAVTEAVAEAVAEAVWREPLQRKALSKNIMISPLMFPFEI
jgi:hypothetical protein